MDYKIIIGIAIAILIIIILIVLISVSVRKKRSLAILDSLENRNSTLKALPVQYLLNKVALMPKSEDVNKQYENWAKTYETISGEKAEAIKNDVNNIETQIYAKKFKRAQEGLTSLERKVKQQELDYNRLLADLTKASQIDVKNREEITNQKELFRNYRKMYQSNYDNYQPYNGAIERYFKNIEDSFANIDVLLNQSQVDKARSKAASLEGELLKMKDILNNLPAILEDLTRDLPQKYQEVESRYNTLAKKGYNLASLEVPSRLTKINKELIRVLSNNNEVILRDLQDTSHYIHFELDKISEELNNEVAAQESLDRLITELVDVSQKAEKEYKKALLEFTSCKDKYVLVKNEEANLDMEKTVLYEFIAEKNEIISKHMSNDYVASDLEKKTKILLPKLKRIILALSAYIKRLDKLTLDEKRLYDEYYNMLYLIVDCESRLNIMDLPILSQAYYDTIQECREGIANIWGLLHQHPLNIDVINSKVNVVREAVYKLYDNSRNLLKTAQMAENTIVFGNRYRSNRPEINTMLERAQIFFNNGEYTKSLSTAIEAIETLYPSIRKELLTYKTNELENETYMH